MAKGKILIVEDDRDIVEMVEYNLKEEGYETLSALNGEDGFELARRQQPDLIILDIMLPIMDALYITKMLDIIMLVYMSSVEPRLAVLEYVCGEMMGQTIHG